MSRTVPQSILQSDYHLSQKKIFPELKRPQWDLLSAAELAGQGELKSDLVCTVLLDGRLQRLGHDASEAGLFS